MAGDRVASWQKFSKHMEEYIRNTVEFLMKPRDDCIQRLLAGSVQNRLR